MSETLDRLRSGELRTGSARDALCVCGKPVEVVFVVQIRERGTNPKTLLTRGMRFCAACALDRLEKSVSS